VKSITDVIFSGSDFSVKSDLIRTVPDYGRLHSPRGWSSSLSWESVNGSSASSIEYRSQGTAGGCSCTFLNILSCVWSIWWWLILLLKGSILAVAYSCLCIFCLPAFWPRAVLSPVIRLVRRVGKSWFLGYKPDVLHAFRSRLLWWFTVSFFLKMGIKVSLETIVCPHP